MLLHLSTVSGCFCSSAAEVRNHKRDHKCPLAHKAQCMYRKCLLLLCWGSIVLSQRLPCWIYGCPSFHQLPQSSETRYKRTEKHQIDWNGAFVLRRLNITFPHWKRNSLCFLNTSGCIGEKCSIFCGLTKGLKDLTSHHQTILYQIIQHYTRWWQRGHSSRI